MTKKTNKVVRSIKYMVLHRSIKLVNRLSDEEVVDLWEGSQPANSPDRTIISYACLQVLKKRYPTRIARWEKNPALYIRQLILGGEENAR